MITSALINISRRLRSLVASKRAKMQTGLRLIDTTALRLTSSGSLRLISFVFPKENEL